MFYLLAVVCFLLLYGSLYPWEFLPGPSLTSALLDVFSDWPARIRISELKDIFVNLLIYLPVGFVGYLSQSKGLRLWRASWPVGLGFLLSLAVETLQHYCPRRVPSTLDLICNTIGALGGVLLALAFESTLRVRWNQMRKGEKLRPSSALMLLLLWTGYHILPLRPTFLGLSWKIRALLHPPAWSWLEFAGAALIWLTLGQLLHSALGHSAGRALLLLSWPSVFLMRIAAPGRSFTWGEAAGAAAGIVGAFLLVGRPRFLLLLLAACWTVWLPVEELRPFVFRSQAATPNVVPFLDLLRSDWLGGVFSLLRKSCLYGTAFWCLERTGIRRGYVIAGLATLVAVLEGIQTHLPGRVPSTTDVAVVLLMGALLWRLELKFGM